MFRTAWFYVLLLPLVLVMGTSLLGMHLFQSWQSGTLFGRLQSRSTS